MTFMYPVMWLLWDFSKPWSWVQQVQVEPSDWKLPEELQLPPLNKITSVKLPRSSFQNRSTPWSYWQTMATNRWKDMIQYCASHSAHSKENFSELAWGTKKTKNIKKPEQQTQIGKVVKSQALTSWCSPPVVQSIACLGPVQGCCKWSQLPWRFVSKEFKNIQNMMQDVNRSAWRLSWSCSKWLIGLTLAWPIRKKNSTQSVSPPFLIQLIFQMTVFSALKSQILDANAVSPEDPMAGTRA
jgi:hypothetical protein